MYWLIECFNYMLHTNNEDIENKSRNAVFKIKMFSYYYILYYLHYLFDLDSNRIIRKCQSERNFVLKSKKKMLSEVFSLLKQIKYFMTNRAIVLTSYNQEWLKYGITFIFILRDKINKLIIHTKTQNREQTNSMLLFS